MGWFFGGVWAIIWILLFIFLGIRTLRRGHWVMFIIGIFFPLFWIIGALIPPDAGRAGLRPVLADGTFGTGILTVPHRRSRDLCLHGL
jgi:hypothetical protein